MSDIFISYARSSEAQAEQVQQALRDAGYNVWRDAKLPAHRTYAEVIEEQLRCAKAVVVLWSGEATKSQWVRAEADAARELGTLIQASVDGTKPPMPFNQIQCADLAGWDGDRGSPGWRKVEGSVNALAGLGRDHPESSARKQKVSICVLPFANMSGDAEQEYFSDGISEDITTDLSNISALAVVARNTAFTFKGGAVDIGQVARKLGVSHVLEGSVRKAGQRLRITAQLIDGETGDHLLAERYDRDLTDIFAIQDEISKAIVNALRVKLLPEEKKAIENRDTAMAEAYNLYLMARQLWATGNHGDPRREEQVIFICQRAIEIDSAYARCWALLAIAQSGLHYGFGKDVDDGVASAERALAIDPAIAEAYCPIARRFITQRRFEEAEVELRTAVRLDPDSWDVNKEAWRLHISQRHFKEAAWHLERCVATMESDYYAWGLLLSCYYGLRNEGQIRRAAAMALVQVEQVLALDPCNGGALGIGARSLAALGQEERSKKWMQRALLADPDNLEMQYNLANAFAAYLRDPTAALDLLQTVLGRTSWSLIGWAHIDPELDTLREDDRFTALVADAIARARKTRRKAID